MIFLSSAKINLTLNITGKDKKDGYHFLRSVFDPVSLYDILDVTLKDAPGITVNDKLRKLNITRRKNIIYKAASVFLKKFRIKKGVTIDLFKHIPDGGGLGGGSSNAAVTLLAMRKMLKVKVSDKVLAAMAAKLGSDVPFFIYSRPALVEGKGEKISFMKKGRTRWYVLVCPKTRIATKDAYAWYDNEPAVSNLISQKKFSIINNINKIDPYNDFEEVVFRRKGGLKRIKAGLLRTGCVGSALSGSGATVFALYKTKSTAFLGYKTMRRKFRSAFVCMAHSI